MIDRMLSGSMSDPEIVEVIQALRERGESPNDICEYVRAISRHARPISSSCELMDVCGTGGSGLNRFNVSTATSFILSALGVPVIKHGNRGSQRPNGSFDLLEALGIDIEQTPAQIERIIAQTNLGFVFAKHYHPSLKFVANARRLAGGRSIFNLAGPLSNPAKVTYQVIGTADEKMAGPLAEACLKLGRKKAAVVFGEPGIDEVSISGPSHIYECVNDRIRGYKITPEDFGITRVPYQQLPGGNVDTNKAIFLKLLHGKADESTTAMVAINAGLALYVAGREASIETGYLAARKCIAAGEMARQFDAYLSALKEG